MADFSVCNLNKLAPLIVAVTMCKSCNYEDPAHTHRPSWLQLRQSSIRRPSPTKKGSFLRDSEDSWTLNSDPYSDSNLRYSLDSYNSCNLRIIVKLLFLLVLFPIKNFHVKLRTSFLWCALFTCTIPLHFSLVVKIDHPITCDRKSQPHLPIFLGFRISKFIFILNLWHVSGFDNYANN